MNLFTGIEEMLSPATESSVAMLLLVSASIEGILFLQALGKFWMLFLSKSHRDAKLVKPS